MHDVVGFYPDSLLPVIVSVAEKGRNGKMRKWKMAGAEQRILDRPFPLTG
jgi:hypothetical protein